MSDAPLYRQWREGWQRQFALGERLEVLAAKHPELPFKVEAYMGRLEWKVDEETLHEFSARVKQVASVFGPAERVYDRGLGDSVYELQADWKVDGLHVQVLAFLPQNCPVDPSHPGRFEHVEARAHPACRAVLKELEDYEPAGPKEDG